MKALEIVQKSNCVGPYLQAKIDALPPSVTPVDHLATLINLISSEIKSLKREEQETASERKQLEALIGMAEKSLQEEMLSEGLVELGGSLIKYVVKLNPHRLIIEDESLIPKEYRREIVTTEIAKDIIKDELKLGTVIPGCKLVQDQSLQQKANKG